MSNCFTAQGRQAQLWEEVDETTTTEEFSAVQKERDQSALSHHIHKVFKEGELVKNSVCAKFATTAADGKTYQVDYLVTFAMF